MKGGGEFWRSNENVQRKGKPRESNPHYTPVENDTKHFWLVEFGTSKTKAQPFMRPALESNIRNATDAFAEKLKAHLLLVDPSFFQFIHIGLESFNTIHL